VFERLGMTDSRAPRASIVIPVFDEVFLTRICLIGLGLADLGDAEVIVVDNGSSDSTPDLLAEWSAAGPRRHVVSSGENLGFARGCNLGAERASGDAVVFLNNDTFVLRDWLPCLLRPFSDPSVWVTGSRLLYPSGRIQHAGVVFIEEGPGHVFAGLRGDLPLVLEEREYQAVTGAAMAIRRDEFERLGRFDTAYYNSYEDVDLCLKVRAAGGRIVYVPTSVAYHWESMSKGRLSANDVRNKDLFLSRWRGRFDADYQRTMDAAEAAGYDLSDRLPSRREQHDRQLALEAAATERDILASELSAVRSEMERTAAERDLLRLIVSTRSVRAARWLASRGRRVLRARS
jgi:GT2 family glycosyltransferase